MTTRFISRIANIPISLPIKLSLIDGGIEFFRIELNSENEVLYPGQVVTGRVVVYLRENIKARAILVHVVGKAKTSWTVWETSKNCNKNQNSNSVVSKKRNHSIPYSAEIAYIDLKMSVWQAESSNHILQAGIQNFPFTFTLPPTCPPSFEGTYGSIQFYCKGKIDRSWKFNDTTQMAFKVLPHFDLNTIYCAAVPISRQASKNIGVLCFKHGRILAKINMPKSGFVPGENFVVTAYINNSTTKEVTKIETSLVEIVSYTARRHHIYINTGPEVQHKMKSRTVVQFSDEFRLASNTEGKFERSIVVPLIVPTFNICPIIQVDYKFKIKIIAKGRLSNSVSCDIPILIGTFPVRVATVQLITQNFIELPEEYLTPPQPSAPLSKSNKNEL